MWSGSTQNERQNLKLLVDLPIILGDKNPEI